MSNMFQAVVGNADFDATKCFDITYAFQHYFTGEVSNPFQGLSLTPGAMVPFQRPEMEQRLRTCIKGANLSQWGIPEAHGGREYLIDPTTLRVPTSDELASVQVNNLAIGLGREAAHIRAYLKQLDAKAKAAKDEQRDREVAQIERKLARDAAEKLEYEQTIQANADDHARYEDFLRVQAAWRRVEDARVAIIGIDRKADELRGQIEYMTRTNSNG